MTKQARKELGQRLAMEQVEILEITIFCIAMGLFNQIYMINTKEFYVWVKRRLREQYEEL